MVKWEGLLSMNIDFHYGVIYILARTAGLPEADAEVVAHACQYVDDATIDGPLVFKDGQCFDRYASAHKMVDVRNEKKDKDLEAWVPFHFVPGGEGTHFEERLICRPDSVIIRAAVQDMLTRTKADNALHRLGVTLHAYVDTWAHQGFCGVVSDINRVKGLAYDDMSDESLAGRIRKRVFQIENGPGFRDAE